jgi:hypothetical protein
LDDAELERLAASGLDVLLPVGRLRAAAGSCLDRGEISGDARYSSLGETLGHLAEFFEVHGAMEAETLDRVNQVLTRHLDGVLHAETAEIGALLARRLREEVLAVLRDDRLARGD